MATFADCSSNNDWYHGFSTGTLARHCWFTLIGKIDGSIVVLQPGLVWMQEPIVDNSRSMPQDTQVTEDNLPEVLGKQSMQ